MLRGEPVRAAGLCDKIQRWTRFAEKPMREDFLKPCNVPYVVYLDCKLTESTIPDARRRADLPMKTHVD